MTELPQTTQPWVRRIGLLAGVFILAAILLIGGWSAARAGQVKAPAPPPQPAALPGQNNSTTAASTLENPGLYVFLDYSNMNPGQYPFIVGGHELFLWRDIERNQQGVYDWSVVDNWIAAEASLGKPVAIGFNSYDGQCCGGERMPTWFKQQHPDGYVTCQDVVIPKYWSSAYKNAWASFIQAAAARYENDPRVKWVVISAGMYGETIPAENQYDACLASNGLTSSGWVRHSQRHHQHLPQCLAQQVPVHPVRPVFYQPAGAARFHRLRRQPGHWNETQQAGGGRRRPGH